MKTLRLHIFKQYFIFSWWSLLFALLVLALLLSLSLWQWHRADEKRQMMQSYSSRMRNPPVSAAEIKADYSPIIALGHYENAETVFLDNQIHAHQVGYEVLTPFVLNNTHQRLIVNRGFIARGASRSILPTVKPIKGDVLLKGIAHFFKKKAFVLGEQQQNSAVIQRIDLKSVNSDFPFIVLLSPQARGGFVREWAPAVAITPEKHVGYAVQWFALALTFLVLFIVVHRRK